VETEDVFVWRGDRLVRGDGYPPHVDRFARAGYDLAALLASTPGQHARVTAEGIPV
jgi:pilus assembly protein CpaF